jgi:hypothetical protein
VDILRAYLVGDSIMNKISFQCLGDRDVAGAAKKVEYPMNFELIGLSSAWKPHQQWFVSIATRGSNYGNCAETTRRKWRTGLPDWGRISQLKSEWF